MNRIDKILKHDLFLYHLHANETAEAQRCFCRHNMVHFLDVARIGEIINLEQDWELTGNGFMRRHSCMTWGNIFSMRMEHLMRRQVLR